MNGKSHIYASTQKCFNRTCASLPCISFTHACVFLIDYISIFIWVLKMFTYVFVHYFVTLSAMFILTLSSYTTAVTGRTQALLLYVKLLMNTKKKMIPLGETQKVMTAACSCWLILVCSEFGAFSRLSK